MQLNEIVFHNGEELKKEFDKIEIEIGDKHNMMLVNYVVLTGQIEVIGDKVVQMDSEGNVISEVECDKIFCLKIYSDENEIPENFEESEKCYSLINHQLQFLDDFERSTIGFDLMKNSDGKSYFLPEDLQEAVISQMSKGQGAFMLPDDFDESQLTPGNIMSEENFIKLVKHNMKSKK